MSDIISMHRADLVDAVTEAVKPLKARIDSLAAGLAVEKMQHSVTIADEHESRTAFQDGIRAIEAELIGEMKLRQTAEAYAARNALRVIAVEAALREAHDAMVDISVQSSMSAVHRMASTSISKTYAALGITPAETKSAPGFCPECLMTGGHKLRCSKAETTPKPITTFTGWIQGSCDNCGKSAREHVGISMGCPQAETACESRCAFDTNNGDRCILPDGHEGNHSL